MIGRSTFSTFWEAIAFLGCVLGTPKVFIVFAVAACPFSSFRRPSASAPFSTLARMQTLTGSRARMAHATFSAGNVGNFVRG